MPQVRFRFGATIIPAEFDAENSTKLYIINGWKGIADNAPKDSTFIYDFEEKTWTSGPKTNALHGDSCATAVGSVIVIAGWY